MRKYFNHSHVRTLIAVFGKLFSRVYIAKHSADGAKIDKLMQIPIRYLPTSHAFMGNVEDNVEVERFIKFYPRLTFDFVGLTYNSAVQRSQMVKYKNKLDGSQVGYTPAPYKLSFTLHIISRDQWMALQILEQILPFFRPNLNVSIHHEVFGSTERDVVINLDSVELEDTYQDQETKRIVHYTLSFTLTTDFWGAVTGTDIELAKFVECGGTVEVDPTVTDSIGTDPDSPEDAVTVVTNPFGLIEKVVIDLHDSDVFKTTDQFWPVQERTTILPVPATASKQSEITSLDMTKSYPSDEATQRIPKL